MTTTSSPSPGILLVNLGSPEEPTIPAIRNYLAEFLMDPLVLHMPGLFRTLLVYGVILPFRPKKTLTNYLSIWRNEGSPLLIESFLLKKKLEAKLKDQHIEVAMRYGSPSLETALNAFRKKNISKIKVVPLYPQYAISTTKTTEEKLKNLNRDLFHKFFDFKVVQDFYDHPGFIEAFTAKAKKVLQTNDVDHLVISFHGLPKNHLGEKIQSKVCNFGNCCENISVGNMKCYRAQCFATAQSIANGLNLPATKWSVSFQSRLTKGWIEPFTDVIIEGLPKKGVQKLAIMCPSFVSDCLETLDEVNIGERHRFLKAGGKEFHYIPCLNDDDLWVNALADICR